MACYAPIRSHHRKQRDLRDRKSTETRLLLPEVPVPTGGRAAGSFTWFFRTAPIVLGMGVETVLGVGYFVIMLHQIKDRLEENSDKRQSVKSLFKMLAVLECFSSTERELSVLEISRRTGLPRTTVHRLVDSLRIVGFLDQDGSWERYRLGLKLFELGNAALINLPLYRSAGPFVDTLAKLSGDIVHLCVFDGTQMIFVERYEDRGRANNVVTTMEATSCHSTGVGKAALAFQPEAVIDRIIERGLKPFTPNTITDPDRLRQELAEIRARGYAIDNCEHEPDLSCVAAPISNSVGRVFAAVSVSGTPRRIEASRIPELANLVMAHAKQISVQLGSQSATSR